MSKKPINEKLKSYFKIFLSVSPLSPLTSIFKNENSLIISKTGLDTLYDEEKMKDILEKVNDNIHDAAQYTSQEYVCHST